MTKNDTIDDFPIPKLLQMADLPTSKPLPGVTPASTAALRELLKENHKRFRCFFSDKGFHNHVAHTAIALWYLGADADVLKAAFADQTTYQRPALDSPGPINKDNWTHHLGNERYYNAYLAFFTSELAVKGPASTLEEYVFSDAANFPGGKHQVVMLSRFNGGLIHPLIHAGYGFEFGLPGMIAEGLAQTAVHDTGVSHLIPAAWFQDSRTKGSNTTSSPLNVLARVLADTSITRESEPEDFMGFLQHTMQKFGDKILQHAAAWKPDVSTKENLRKTVEDVVFFVNLIYAVPGLVSKEEGTFNADFFTMHFVTSSMFLSSVLLHLKPKSQELLLKSYFSVCLFLFVSRGKPPLDIEAFFSHASSLKSLLDTSTVTRPALPRVSVKSANPWSSILEETIVHPDDHLPKLQRTLSHYAQAYGNIEAGHFKGLELKGAEKVDGTLFVRAANLTSYRLNNTSGEAFGGYVSWWDRSGFYKNV